MRSPGEMFSKAELNKAKAETAAHQAAMKKRGSRERKEEAQELREDRKLQKELEQDPEYVKFMAWCKAVHDRGEWGPSPGGAAMVLGCSRAMVDRLVAAGVLVRNDYPESDVKFRNIRISRASILKAQQNKKTTGKWNEEKLPDGAIKVWKLP